MRHMRFVAGLVAVALAGAVSAGEGAAPGMAELEAALAKAAGFKYGESRAALADAERLIPVLAQDAVQRGAIEKRLIALLVGEGTNDCKAFVCRMLSFVGSAEAVPALAKLLADKEMSHHARLALERIPAPEALAALREALGRVQGVLLVGVVNSLGERRDAAAVPPLAKLAQGGDAAVAEAAVAALGKIGGAEAAAAIAAVRTMASGRLRPAATDAYLLCADGFVAAGKRAEAATIYQQVYDSEKQEHVRTAAFRGLLATGNQAAWELIVKTLSGNDPGMWGAAAAFAREVPGTEATKALAAALAKLSPPAQVLLLNALAARGDPAACRAVIRMLESREDAVREAALAALGAVGHEDPDTVIVLARIGGPVARRSLERLKGKGADEAMLAALGVVAVPLRLELIRVLGARNATSAVEPLLKLGSEDADAAVRAEAVGALGLLADARALPALVRLLLAAKTDGERAAAEKAIVAVCRRIEDKEAATAPVIAALPGPDGAARCALLRILARTPSAKGLGALRAASGDADAAVRDVGVRGMADWPDAVAMPDLLAIARTAESQVHKVLALRGFIRLAALPSDRPAEQTTKLLGEALALAASPDDKKLALAALANVAHKAALDIAVACLADPAIEVEAATAVTQIAKNVRRTDRDAAKAALQRILEVCKTPAARQVAESALLVVDTALNIAPQGTASSRGGSKPDGGSGPPQAAIDGDPATYWDEDDHRKVYRFAVTFKQPEHIAAITILGYQHHNYAPRDFEVLCDGKVVRNVENAQYDDNFLVISLGDGVTCRDIELRITGYYGSSAAIRELGLYPPGGKMLPMKTPPPKR